MFVFFNTVLYSLTLLLYRNSALKEKSPSPKVDLKVSLATSYHHCLPPLRKISKENSISSANFFTT